MADKPKPNVKMKHEHGLEKTDKPKPKAESNGSMQNILAILLVISLLANAFLIIQANDLNRKIAELSNTGVITTTSTTQPAGNKAVATGDYVKVDYVGSFTNGTLFDTSVESEARNAGIYSSLRTYEPLGLVVGAGTTLPGFENGIIGMKVGETKTITIPPGEGYTTGSLAGETLVFKVTLREIPAVEAVKVIVLSDSRCADCDAGAIELIERLKDVVPGAEFTQLDYGTDEGKKLYAEAKLQYLPAILFEQGFKNAEGYSTLSNYLEAAGPYLSLRIGAEFDPEAEICDNGVDDNGNGLIDCADESCKGEFACMEKKDKPLVEAFVMSHCPYGTQIEKGLLPVVKLLGDKIDFSVKFCDYAMHGKKELDEQLLQVCIQNEDKDKYLTYLGCFLNESKSAECLTKAGLDAAKLSLCVNKTDAEFNVTAGYNDKSTWMSGYYPVFNVYKDLNEKYGVQGSPTLVVNGVIAQTGRSPSSLLEAICVGFKEKPAECSQNLSTANPSAGFGYGESDAATVASCGA